MKILLVDSHSIPLGSKNIIAASGGNTGNAFIGGVIKSLLRGHEVDEIQSLFSLHGTIYEDFNDCDLFLFSLKDYIRPDYKNIPWKEMTHSIKKIKTNVIVLGLGANFVNREFAAFLRAPGNEMIEFFRTLSDRSTVFSVRGDTTNELLYDLGIKAVTLGCPSLFVHGSLGGVRHNPSLSPEGLTLIGGGVFSFSSWTHHSMLILQDELVLNTFLGNGTLDLALVKEALPVSYPGYFASVVRALSSGKAFIFSDAREWVDSLSRIPYGLSVGTRIHGAIAALNAGHPAIVTSGDSRAAEICAYFNIPIYPGAWTGDWNFHEKYLEWDIEKFNTRYRVVWERFSITMEKAGLSLTSPLEKNDRSDQEVFAPQGNSQKMKLRHGRIRGSIPNLDHLFLSERTLNDALIEIKELNQRLVSRNAELEGALVEKEGLNKELNDHISALIEIKELNQRLVSRNAELEGALVEKEGLNQELNDHIRGLEGAVTVALQEKNSLIKENLYFSGRFREIEAERHRLNDLINSGNPPRG